MDPVGFSFETKKQIFSFGEKNRPSWKYLRKKWDFPGKWAKSKGPQISKKNRLRRAKNRFFFVHLVVSPKRKNTDMDSDTPPPKRNHNRESDPLFEDGVFEPNAINYSQEEKRFWISEKLCHDLSWPRYYYLLLSPNILWMKCTGVRSDWINNYKKQMYSAQKVVTGSTKLFCAESVMYCRV